MKLLVTRVFRQNGIWHYTDDDYNTHVADWLPGALIPLTAINAIIQHVYGDDLTNEQRLKIREIIQVRNSLYFDCLEIEERTELVRHMNVAYSIKYNEMIKMTTDLSQEKWSNQGE